MGRCAGPSAPRIGGEVNYGGEMSGGVGAAAAEAVAAFENQVDAHQLVQSALFDLDASETGALDAPSPLSAAIPEAGRKGGRRPGSRNRRTEAVAAWLLSQHRHPLSVMMEAYTMEPAALAERIGLRRTVDEKDADGRPVKVWSNDTLLEVFKLQLRMAEAVAPYVAQKMPQAHQFEGKAAVELRLAGVSLPARGAPPQGEGQVLEGEVMGVRLPQVGQAKSDG